MDTCGDVFNVNFVCIQYVCIDEYIYDCTLSLQWNFCALARKYVHI